MKYKIIEKETNKDVTSELQTEYKQALLAKTDVEMYRAFGNPPSTIPSDNETKLILLQNLLVKIFNQ